MKPDAEGLSENGFSNKLTHILYSVVCFLVWFIVTLVTMSLQPLQGGPLPAANHHQLTPSKLNILRQGLNTDVSVSKFLTSPAWQFVASLTLSLDISGKSSNSHFGPLRTFFISSSTEGLYIGSKSANNLLSVVVFFGLEVYQKWYLACKFIKVLPQQKNFNQLRRINHRQISLWTCVNVVYNKLFNS